ncbi:hypothetical protein BDQ17DRAFT_1536934 [Cyathus striatus]|nr:hypothetical protein BDQ17DRAFT_1536934 [Cyathus striatus]
MMMSTHSNESGHQDSMHNYGMGDMDTDIKMIAERTKFLNVWIYFNLIFNTLLLPLLVFTFIFSKKAKRHAALVNMCITWILSGVFSLFIFYAGEYGPGIKPPKMLCIAQTSLLYGIAPMWAVSVLMLMVYISMAFRKPPKLATGFSMILLLAAPYITEILFSLATLVLAMKSGHVGNHMEVYYCTLSNQSLLVTMGLFTTIVGLMIILLEVYLAMIVYRVWQGRKHAGESSQIDFQILVRVLVFSAYIIFGMVMGIMKTVSPKSVLPDMYAATAGAVVFLTFATQADVIRVWLFWLPERWMPKSWKEDKPPPYLMTETPLSRENKGGPKDEEVAPIPPPKPIWYINGMRLSNGARFTGTVVARTF